MPLNSDLEHISSWSSNNHVTFNASKTSFPISLKSHSCVASVLFDSSVLTHELFSAHPLVVYCAGLSSCLGLLLSLRGKLVFCSTPAVCSPRFIFYYVNFKSASQLNIAVTCGVGLGLLRFPLVGFKQIWPIDDFSSISLQSPLHRRSVASLSLFYRYYFFLCSSGFNSAVPPVTHSRLSETQVISDFYQVSVSWCRASFSFFL